MSPHESRTPRLSAFLCSLAVLPILPVLAVLAASAAGFAADIDPLACRIVPNAGAEAVGTIRRIEDQRISILDGGGQEMFFAYHEVQEIQFASFLRSGAKEPRSTEASDDNRDDDDAGAVRSLADRPDARAFLVFSSGELLPAKILRSEGEALRVLVRGRRDGAVPYGEPLGEIALPLGAIRAFRLREAYREHAAFEDALGGGIPDRDAVFYRRDRRLLRIDGVFRGIDDEKVRFEYEGREGGIPRNLVQGLILSQVAGTTLELGNEGSLEVAGDGRLPAVLKGLITSAADSNSALLLRLEVRGVAWEVPLSEVRRINFDSDRIRFLSDVEPARVEEVPLFDNRFPYRKDLSVTGEPLRLDGFEYRKGLGVHSRAVLEYEIRKGFTTFVARVGIHDGPAGRGDAVVRVLADDEELAEHRVRHGEKPVQIVLSVAGRKVLRLLTDYGEDGLDLGDHVDWAEARLVKSSASGTAVLK